MAGNVISSHKIAGHPCAAGALGIDAKGIEHPGDALTLFAEVLVAAALIGKGVGFADDIEMLLVAGVDPRGDDQVVTAQYFVIGEPHKIASHILP